MSELEDLLAVQELDTKIDQLAFRRDNVPELAAVEALRRQVVEAEAEAEAVVAELRRIHAAERESEDHASLCGDKAASIEASLYDGSVVSHKELETLQAELAQLKERQSHLEDEALELLDRAAPFEAQLVEHRAAIAVIEEQIGSTDAARVVAQAELGVEHDAAVVDRDAARAALPGELLATYDDLRVGLGGVAVARLVGPRCDGCHLQIPAVDLDTIRHTDPSIPVHCPECQRILVH